MPKTGFIPYLCVVAAGAAAGWGGSHFARMKPEVEKSGPASAGGGAVVEVKSMPVYSRPLPDAAADPLSPEYYAQMAIWATEASAADIERFWKETSGSDVYRPGVPSLDAVFLPRWVELDPEGAVRAFGNAMIGSGPAWTAWANHDPDKALAAAKASGRKRSIEWVIKGIAEVNPERALEMVAKDPSLAPFVIGSITAQYAKAGKFREAVDLKTHYGSYVLVPEMKEWAKEDPHAAMRWCIDHPYGAPENRNAVYETFLKEYPDQVNELMAILPNAATKLEFARKRVEQMVGKDPDQAMAFVRSQQDVKARNELSILLADKLVATDWDKAAFLYKEYAANNGRVSSRSTCIYINEENHVYASPDTSSAFSWMLLRNLSLARPRETFEIASSLSNERDRSDVQKSAVENWLSSDRYSFSEFLASQPGSPEKDRWASMLSDSLSSYNEVSKNDFPNGLEWAFSISDNDIKTKAVCEVITNWREKDEVGFGAYMGDPGTPKANKEMIRKLLTPSGNE